MEEGGTILYPTDTIWGLGCDALSEAAVSRVFALKQRPNNKSLIILLAEARDILQYVAAPPPDIISIVEQFTEPTTVIYRQGLEVAPLVLGADGSIGIRVTNDPFCKALIKRLKRPIVSTSANISGKQPPAHFKEVEPMIIHHTDYVVSYRRDDGSLRPPSRLVKIDDDGVIELVR